ncbi:MAG: M48 family metallopeptidase [Thioploca sp.]|nr:M48 family metallopeptidase [Thioploca sp.]
MFKKIVIPLMTLLLLSCVTSPTGRKQLLLMPADQVDTMGVEAFNTLKQETPLETNYSVNRYVTCVANAIIQVSNSPVKDWEIAVFRDESANAFALPGGKIGVNTGLLKVAEDQNQLGTVIGHEIAHVLANHSNERVSQEYAVQQGIELIQAVANVQTQMGQTMMGLLGVGAQFGILLPYSRTHESEADIFGLNLMAAAGFDPRASITLWQNMERAGSSEAPEFLSTHPSHNTRINDLQNAMNNALSLFQQAQTGGRRPNCQ